MKFSPIEIPSIPSSLAELGSAVSRCMYEVFNILRNLSFSDNFGAYVWEGSIAPGAEQVITHSLKVIPSGYVVTKNSGGIIVDGSTQNTTSKLYVRNAASLTTATVRIVVFK